MRQLSCADIVQEINTPLCSLWIAVATLKGMIFIKCLSFKPIHKSASTELVTQGDSHSIQDWTLDKV